MKLYKLIRLVYQGSISKCENILSAAISITQGIHLGNVLIPVLFNIFIHVIDNNLSKDG